MYPTMIGRPPTAVLYLALLLFAAPAGAQQDMSGWPEWLRSAMAAESKRVRSKKHDFADGASVKLPGKVTNSQAVESGWYFVADIGAGGSIECYVFTSEPELASVSMQLGDGLIEFISDAYGPVGSKTLYELDAGAIEGVPYFALDWMFTVGEAPEAKASMSKVRAAANGELVQACSHTGLGYRETLDRVFRTFVTSLDYPRTAPAPYYREVVRLDFGEQPVGLIWFSYELDADGDTLIRYSDAQIVPVDTATVQTGDTVTTSFSYPDGRLINKSVGVVENGELTTFVELIPNDGLWEVSGTFQGKEIQTTLDGDIAPISELGQQFSAEEVIRGDSDSVTVPVWIPEADPTSFLMATIERIDGDGRNNARFAMGPITMDVELDDTGSARTGSMQIGAATVTMERIHVEGKAR